MDNKVLDITTNMFVKYMETCVAEHTHRGYTLKVTLTNNTTTFLVTKKGRTIHQMSDTSYPNCSAYTQRDTLFEISTVDTIYKYLYIMYHTKVNSQDLKVNVI